MVEALLTADQIVLGPGSLFTSVLAAIAVPGVRAAIERSPASVVYVCNLRPQVPETEGFDVAMHVEALMDHGVTPDLVVCDPAGLPTGKPRSRCARRRWPGPTVWPTTRPDWRRCCRVCSDDRGGYEIGIALGAATGGGGAGGAREARSPVSTNDEEQRA